MSLRTPLAAVFAVIILFLAVWAYGSYVAAVARQEVVEHQIIAPESGDDCATFDEVASLDSVLDKLTMAQRRFLDGESPASAQRQWIAELTPQLDTFLASHRCARVGDTLDEPPAHWDDWITLVDGRAALGTPADRVAIYAELWRVGHALQRDLWQWERGASMVEHAATRLARGLGGGSPSVHRHAVTESEALAASAPGLHDALDAYTYREELEAFDAAASGWLSGLQGLGLAQAVNVFHPVYYEYVALRELPWQEREARLTDWQLQVDSYNHPIYVPLQEGRILLLEQRNARHVATVEAALVATHVARFRGTYGACPSAMERLGDFDLVQPLGELALEGCAVVVGKVRVDPTGASPRP